MSEAERLPLQSIRGEGEREGPAHSARNNEEKKAKTKGEVEVRVVVEEYHQWCLWIRPSSVI